MSVRPRLLVGVLHWGLGHATRCIPLIEQAERQGFEVIIASDGPALALLQQHFPQHLCVELPAYRVRYSRQGRWMLLYWLWQSAGWWRTYRRERQWLQTWLQQQPVHGILSDSRPGLFAAHLPCVYLTHQVQPQARWLTPWAQWMHQRWMRRFTQIWVPDQPAPRGLSGSLGHGDKPEDNLCYMGPLSRCQVPPQKHQAWQIIAVLSGPEPQRSILEQQLLKINLQGQTGLLIRGIWNKKNTTWPDPLPNQWQVIDFATAADIAGLAQHHPLWISRSGYSSLMDWQVLRQKAILIPTPGQPEQEYLGKWIQLQQWLPVMAQQDLDERLWHLPWERYVGLPPIEKQPNWAERFTIFRG